MKKRVFGFLLVAMLLAAVMVGCGSVKEFVVEGNQEGDKVTVTSKNAGDGAGGGYIKINDGQVLSVDAKVEKGKYEIIVLKSDGSKKDFLGLDKIKDEDTVLKFEVDKEGKTTKEIPAGEYNVAVKSSDGATGSLTITAAKQ